MKDRELSGLFSELEQRARVCDAVHAPGRVHGEAPLARAVQNIGEQASEGTVSCTAALQRRTIPTERGDDGCPNEIRDRVACGRATSGSLVAEEAGPLPVAQRRVPESV